MFTKEKIKRALLRGVAGVAIAGAVGVGTVFALFSDTFGLDLYLKTSKNPEPDVSVTLTRDTEMEQSWTDASAIALGDSYYLSRTTMTDDKEYAALTIGLKNNGSTTATVYPTVTVAAGTSGLDIYNNLDLFWTADGVLTTLKYQRPYMPNVASEYGGSQLVYPDGTAEIGAKVQNADGSVTYTLDAVTLDPGESVSLNKFRENLHMDAPSNFTGANITTSVAAKAACKTLYGTIRISEKKDMITDNSGAYAIDVGKPIETSLSDWDTNTRIWDGLPQYPTVRFYGYCGTEADDATTTAFDGTPSDALQNDLTFSFYTGSDADGWTLVAGPMAYTDFATKAPSVAGTYKVVAAFTKFSGVFQLDNNTATYTIADVFKFTSTYSQTVEGHTYNSGAILRRRWNYSQDMGGNPVNTDAFNWVISNTSASANGTSGITETFSPALTVEFVDTDGNVVPGAAQYVMTYFSDSLTTDSVSLPGYTKTIGVIPIAWATEIADKSVNADGSVTYSLPSFDLAASKSRTIGVIVPQLSKDLPASYNGLRLRMIAAGNAQYMTTSKVISSAYTTLYRVNYDSQSGIDYTVGDPASGTATWSTESQSLSYTTGMTVTIPTITSKYYVGSSTSPCAVTYHYYLVADGHETEITAADIKLPGSYKIVASLDGYELCSTIANAATIDIVSAATWTSGPTPEATVDPSVLSYLGGTLKYKYYSVATDGTLTYIGTEVPTATGVYAVKINTDGVIISLRHNTQYFTVGNVSPTYTRYATVSSTGSQYINTGIKPTNTTAVEVNLLPCTPGNIFGAKDASNAVGFIDNYSCYPRVNYGKSNYYTFGYDMSTKATMLELDNGKFYINNTYYKTLSSAAFSISQEAYLGAYNSAGTLSSGKTMTMKDTKIFESGVIKRWFVGATASDGTTGLYDLIQRKFYPNAGTGAYTYGTALKEDITLSWNTGVSGESIYTWDGTAQADTATAMDISGETFDQYAYVTYYRYDAGTLSWTEIPSKPSAPGIYKAVYTLKDFGYIYSLTNPESVYRIVTQLPTYTYYRVSVSDFKRNGTSASFASFAEIHLFAEDLTTKTTSDVSSTAGAVYTASSVYAASNAAAAAFDGNTSTIWHSSTSSATSWVQIQLPSAVYLKSYTLTPRQDSWTDVADDFTMLGSNDGLNWTTLSNVSGAAGSFANKATGTFYAFQPDAVDLTWDEGDLTTNAYAKSVYAYNGTALKDTATGPDYCGVKFDDYATESLYHYNDLSNTWEQLTAAPTQIGLYKTVYSSSLVKITNPVKQFTIVGAWPTYTYFRVTFTDFRRDGVQTNLANVAELGLYAVNPDTGDITDVARSAGAVYTANSQTGTSEQAAYAFDGNTSTIWQSAVSTNTNWLQVKLSSAQYLDYVTVVPRQVLYNNHVDTPNTFIVQGSNDGLSWTTLRTVANEMASFDGLATGAFNAVPYKIVVHADWPMANFTYTGSAMPVTATYSEEFSDRDGVKTPITDYIAYDYYSYSAANGSWTLLSAAPSDIGTYKVVAKFVGTHTDSSGTYPLSDVADIATPEHVFSISAAIPDTNPLPSNYTRLQYITSSHSDGAYGTYMANITLPENFKFVMDTMLTSTTSYYNIYDASSSSPMLWVTGSGQLELNGNSTRADVVKDEEIIITSDATGASNTLSVSTPLTSSLLLTGSKIAGAHSVSMLNRSGSQTFGGRIYDIKVFDGDTLVMHLVPAKNPQNIACLYDVMTGTEYDSLNTGDPFVEGPELPSYAIAPASAAPVTVTMTAPLLASISTEAASSETTTTATDAAESTSTASETAESTTSDAAADSPASTDSSADTASATDAVPSDSTSSAAQS